MAVDTIEQREVELRETNGKAAMWEALADLFKALTGIARLGSKALEQELERKGRP